MDHCGNHRSLLLDSSFVPCCCLTRPSYSWVLNPYWIRVHAGLDQYHSVYWVLQRISCLYSHFIKIYALCVEIPSGCVSSLHGIYVFRTGSVLGLEAVHHSLRRYVHSLCCAQRRHGLRYLQWPAFDWLRAVSDLPLQFHYSLYKRRLECLHYHHWRRLYLSEIQVSHWLNWAGSYSWRARSQGNSRRKRKTRQNIHKRHWDAWQGHE